MKRKVSPVMALWLLITVSMMIFVGLSLSDDITLWGHTFSKAGFTDTLLATDEETIEDHETPSEEKIISENDTIAKEIVVVEPDTTVHTVLVFGDSMTHHLAMSISKFGTRNNYKVTGVTWESSSIPGWLNSGKIEKYLEMVKPDYIFVSLGSNEMELKNFDSRVPDIKKIVEKFDTIPYVWVGPPLWKADKGVYKMLEKALPEGVIFKAENLNIPRGKDHIHPTLKGADLWADTLMRWISTSSHPILSEKPDSGTTTKGHKFIYLHPED